MKEKRWIIKKDYDNEVVDHLMGALGVDRIIATLLAQRGITTFDEAKQFFRPSLNMIHDPFLMKDMRQAIDRINLAIANKEKILIYGDYDVDGTSAVALVYSYFHNFFDNIDFYIPDRETEGYGISFKGVDYAHSTDVKLIIALDCGIKAVEQIDQANLYGIDVIVGDHHLPGDTLPKACAILDPKRNDCPYPYKELSGCGIGFKIVEAYIEEKMNVRLCDNADLLTPEARAKQEDLKRRLLKYLDLVTVSIASDIVPITGENRVLATYGLRVINTKPRPGIEAILHHGHIEPRSHFNTSDNEKKNSYFNKDLTINDLVFLVGPRINAAGRIRSARDSVRLLMSADLSESRKLAEEINEFNNKRKDFDRKATEDAHLFMRANPEMNNRRSIVLYNDQWHKGVVGIVASRLVEEYYRPTVIFTRSTDNLLVGSARSIKEFDVHAALEECADLLEHFGGHRCAAGVSLRIENLQPFIERFENIVQEALKDELIMPEIEIDAVIEHMDEQITEKFLRILKQFAPFGPENTTPIFITHNVVDSGFARAVGQKELKHLKFSPIQIDYKSQFYSAIGFGLGEYDNTLRNGTHFDMCYSVEENFWNGKTEIQLNVKDIHTR